MAETGSSMHFGSPNRVPTQICYMLKRLASGEPGRDRDLLEQDGLTALFLAMNAIEAFTNIHFRVIAEEEKFRHARAQILKEMDGPTGKKLVRWTKAAFGKAINETDPRWAAFRELRERRNGFTHFRSSHETVILPGGIALQGAVNMQAFADLKPETPKHALQVVRGVVEMVGECHGLSPSNVTGFVHLWTGII